jgi:hypothetical protein
MSENIRLNRRTCVLVSVIIICAYLYAIPFFSATQMLAWLAVTAAAIVVLLVYEHHRIYGFKFMRDDVAKELDALLSDV